MASILLEFLSSLFPVIALRSNILFLTTVAGIGGGSAARGSELVHILWGCRLGDALLGAICPMLTRSPK